ncbi:glycosyl hydrolase 53 family protein [Cellulosilyticum ruminicola]
MNKLTIEEYYIRLLECYGQNGETYRELGWQDELINNIKNSTAYAVLQDRLKKGIKSDTIYGLNNRIVEIYAYQREQNKKYSALKQNVDLLMEGDPENPEMSININPSGDIGNGWCDKANTLNMAKRAKALGRDVMIDFHYSDTGADPANQKIPAAWR